MKNFSTVIVILMGLCLITSVKADQVMHLRGDGTSLDSTGNGHDGSLINGTSYAVGKLGQAFSFDGVNDHITVNASGDLEPSPEISVAMWIKATAGGGIKLLMDSSHGSSNGNFGWAIQMTNAGAVGLAYGNGSSFPAIDSTTIIGDGTFHHFATTLDGTDMRIYVDGVLEATSSYSGTPMGTGQQIRLGRHFSLNRQYNGLLDDVRIYNHALSGSEVLGLTSVPEPGALSLLVLAAAGMVARRRRR